ncbi:hypothetical protein [Nonomuraea roseola]|uniref:Flagellar biosynthetic protein FliP n=1 Tax=Nonomuraea roseola TaxID=46179 RepID=A0ABV5QAP3_9ACTN
MTKTATLRFAWHFGEMLVAMILGMVLLGPVWDALTSWLGLAALFARTDVAVMVMAADMTVAMTIWMRYRGHSWAPVAEMGAAMFVPFLLLLPPYWLGALSGEVVMIAGHVLMLPAMLAAMLWRKDEYTRGHKDHRSPPAVGRPS